MSKPVLTDVFKFSGRRNRQSYILLVLAQLGALVGLAVLTGLAIAVAESAAALSYLLFIAVLAGFIAVAVSGWAAGSQRIRDFGHSGVWILLTLIPYIGWIVCLAIMFVPSTSGENKYGPSCI
jgi:uncharacterized membrane protein YhaH (DUF805 family)